ncbi:MAG: hypothetical protein LUG85_04395, partial [Clostridiales bacterium]|nr:hypothetical protein [Clostridiales bacterium]
MTTKNKTFKKSKAAICVVCALTLLLAFLGIGAIGSFAASTTTDQIGLESAKTIALADAGLTSS